MLTTPVVRMWTALAVLWACFALAILSTRFNVLRLRTLLVGGALLGVTVVVRALRRGWQPRVPSVPVTVLVAVQGLLILLSSLRHAPADRPFGIASLALLTGIGWFAWIETRARPASVTTTAVSLRTGLLVFAGCMLVSAALVTGFWIAVRAPLVTSTEELLYRIQARALAGAEQDYAVDPALLGALRLPWVEYGADTLLPQSAAAWPLLLSASRWLGVERWLGLLLTLVNVALTALVGRKLFGLRGALLAAAFVAVNPIIARFGPTYLSHAATVTLVLSGTALLLTAVAHDTNDARRLPAEIGAGVLLGLAVLMRPFGGTIVTVSMLLWLHLREPGPRGHLLNRTLPRLAIGAVPPIAAFLLLDGFSLGFPLRWSHSALFAGALPGRDAGVLSAGIGEALKATWFSFGALGAFAAAGILLMSGVRPRLRAVAPFLLLPVLVVLVSGGTVATYHLLVPFVGLGFAWSILELRRRDALVARTASALTLAGALTVSALLLYSMGHLDRLPAQLHATVEAAAARSGPLLVIVPVGTPEEVITRLWAYNIDGTGGRVVVALETNPVTNRLVLERYADRRAMVLREAPGGAWRLRPLILHELPVHLDD